MGVSTAPGTYPATIKSGKKVDVWYALGKRGIFGPYFFLDNAGNRVTVDSERYIEMIRRKFVLYSAPLSSSFLPVPLVSSVLLAPVPSSFLPSPLSYFLPAPLSSSFLFFPWHVLPFPQFATATHSG